MKSQILAAALACTALSLSAQTVLFDGTVGQPASFITGSNGTTEISSEILYNGHDVLKFTPAGSYKSGGLQYYGGDIFTVPSGESILRVVARAGDTGNFNSMVVNLYNGPTNISQDFNSAQGTWTLDGDPGMTANFTPDTWHEMFFDLSSVPGFSAGTTQINGFVAFKNNTGTDTIYIGEMGLIPEPSTYAAIAGILALGVAGFIRRRSS